MSEEKQPGAEDQELNLKEKVIKEEAMEITTLPTIEDLDEKIKMVDKVFQYMQKLKEFALKHVSANNVIDESGKPYIMENGVTTFRGPFGIYEKDLKGFVMLENGTQKDIDSSDAFKGEVASIRYEGIIGSKILGIEANYIGGVYLDDKNKKFKDKSDIIFYTKKARANWTGRGIRKLLGIDNITWEDLEKHGIKRSDAGKVERKGAATGDEQKLRDEVNSMLIDMHGKDNVSKELEKITTFPDKQNPNQMVPGLTQVSYLKGKRLEFTHSNIKKVYDKFSADMPSGSSTDAKAGSEAAK